MKLVDDWKQAWKWISVQSMTVAMAIQGAWMFIPEDMKASIPKEVVHGITMALLFVGIVGRLKKQGKDDAAN